MSSASSSSDSYAATIGNNALTSFLVLRARSRAAVRMDERMPLVMLPCTAGYAESAGSQDADHEEALQLCALRSGAYPSVDDTVFLPLPSLALRPCTARSKH